MSWCGSVAEEPSPVAPPESRAAYVETVGCGFASSREGAGVAIGGELIVTVAHLVVQSEKVLAAVGADPRAQAEVIAVDLQKDLALLRVSGLDLPGVDYGTASRSTTGVVVGGATTGAAPFEVLGVVDISIEEVLGTERNKRRGYKLDAATGSGDSGAGAYDAAGALIGIVFAFSEEPLVSWVTGGGEIAAFVAEADPKAAALACDPSLSRLRLATDEPAR